jgi:hypothetical protein
MRRVKNGMKSKEWIRMKLSRRIEGRGREEK